MRRLIALVTLLAVIGGGTAVALASHRTAARPALPLARQGALQVIAFTDARPSAAARGSLSAHLASLSAVSPSWLALGRNGTIAYHDTDGFSRGLAARGAGLVPVLRDPEKRIADVLGATASRKHVALRLAVMVRALGAKGLVLDLGDVPAADRAALPAFLRDLRAGLPARSSLMLVIPPISDAASARANAGYDLRDLSRPATLVLRAWRGATGPQGPQPIAALSWYKQTLRYTLAHAPRSRVIVALPTFGELWTPQGVVRKTQAELFRLARPGALTQAAGARVEDDGHVAWVESDRSLQLKLEVARAAHVSGVALWVRGGESAGVWREPLLAPPTQADGA
jgi:spore germination protein YaaH